jgi:two-component system, OmpR family, heavy metal sensor histidine kinase CusS
VNFTIRAKLTLLYFLVLAASFCAFFWVCDLGFRRSIETTVNEASRSNLKIVQRVLENSAAKGAPKVQKELGELSELWANGAIFEVAGADGQWIFRAPRFLKPEFPLPAPSANAVSFVTRNLDLQQYRIAQERVTVEGQVFQIDAAVPTEPFDQALDNFRLIVKRFLPILVVLASLLGYWLSGRALAPVSRIIHSAEQIGLSNLSRRLEVPTARDELRRLTETLNAMLGRIESSVNRLRRFTADASHDLRTPLALLRTNAELALRRPRTELEYREALTRILEISEETTGLIEALLTLARADSGGTHLQCKPLDATPILQKAAREASLLAVSKGLTFSAKLAESALLIRADGGAIEKLLLSLLDNAVKYTPAGGAVIFRSMAAQEEAVIEVEDTGIGICEEDQEHIFDRFFRADQARSRKVPGSGLGLSIAKWIAEAHKGGIEVVSRLGAGSLFRIRLPLIDTKPAADAGVPEGDQMQANVT